MFLSLTFLGHRHIVPLAAAVTTKHSENVAAISSNNSLLYLMRNVTGGHTTWFLPPQRQGSIAKTRDLWEIEPLLIANHISAFYLSMGPDDKLSANTQQKPIP